MKKLIDCSMLPGADWDREAEKCRRMYSGHSVVPNSFKELNELEPGALVRVTPLKPYKNWEVYEGIIDGKYAFMLQDSVEPTKINSSRISRESITFENGVDYVCLPLNIGGNDINIFDNVGDYGVVTKEAEIVPYTPEHPEYQRKRMLMIMAGKWRGD